MDVFEVITNRRSHRGEFRNSPIKEVDLDKIIEACTMGTIPIQCTTMGIVNYSRGTE